MHDAASLFLVLNYYKTLYALCDRTEQGKKAKDGEEAAGHRIQIWKNSNLSICIKGEYQTMSIA